MMRTLNHEIWKKIKNSQNFWFFFRNFKIKKTCVLQIAGQETEILSLELVLVTHYPLYTKISASKLSLCKKLILEFGNFEKKKSKILRLFKKRLSKFSVFLVFN
jgi:hypothetical protein